VIRDPDALRTVWLFGKPYWWDRAGGRLTLTPAAPEPERAAEPLTFEEIAALLGGPLRVP
jgi:hypothetical protein